VLACCGAKYTQGMRGSQEEIKQKLIFFEEMAQNS
jgi:hypothetical protein